MEDRSSRYRIGQLAARTGISPDLLRAWEKRYGLLAPQRSEGGFRLYSQDDERRVQVMQRHLSAGMSAAQAAQLARDGIVATTPLRRSDALPRGVVRRTTMLLEKAFREFDQGAAERALDELFSAFTVDAVLRDAIYPFMRSVGKAWAVGDATVGQEHFASTLIATRLMQLARGWGTGSGPRALLACPAGERHTLGLVGFGLCLARRGWRITYLGAESPSASILHAAETTAPSLIALSAARPDSLRSEAVKLSKLADVAPVAIGGAGASEAAARRLGATLYATDPGTAAARIAVERSAIRTRSGKGRT